MSLESDPWLADHSIDGTPVFLGVIGLELMSAVAAPPRRARAPRMWTTPLR